MQCPRCHSKVGSHEWSMYVTCTNPKCKTLWTYDEFVAESRRQRLVWVYGPDTAYLRLCDKDELRSDGTVEIDGKPHAWKPIA